MMLLPYPPSTNRYWRTFRGRTVRSAEARDYKEQAQQIAAGCGVDLHTGPVEVEMVLHPVRPKDWEKRRRKDPCGRTVRRIDLDNAMKVALDALQGLAYEDDRQIERISISLGEPVDGGAVGVLVQDLKE